MYKLSQIRFVCLLFLVLCCSSAVFAQISVGIQADRQKYLRYESVNIQVILRNDSGNTLIFGEDPKTDGYMFFRVKDPRGLDSGTIGNVKVNPVENMILGAGETRQLTVVLNNLFRMQREGVYIIHVQVGHPRLPMDYRSKDISLEVRDGVEVWNQRIGIPQEQPGEKIQTRRASLLVINDETGGIYALRMEDDDLVYGTVRLSRRLASTAPQCEIDGLSHVHVLVQSEPRLYTYYVFNYNLTLQQTRYYAFGDTPPRLIRDPDIGRVMVAGGRVAIPGVDYIMESDTARGESRRRPEQP